MNDNVAPSKKAGIGITLFVMFLIACIPGGIIGAWYIESGYPLIISVIAFLIMMAG